MRNFCVGKMKGGLKFRHSWLDQESLRQFVEKCQDPASGAG